MPSIVASAIRLVGHLGGGFGFGSVVLARKRRATDEHFHIQGLSADGGNHSDSGACRSSDWHRNRYPSKVRYKAIKTTPPRAALPPPHYWSMGAPLEWVPMSVNFRSAINLR